MKKIMCVICIISVFFLGACSATVVNAEQSNPLKIWKHNDNGRYSTLCVVDENTGVNYVVVANNYNYDVAITPRLNTDGTLYITK